MTVGYFQTKAQIKALGTSDRFDGLTFFVQSLKNVIVPESYMFVASSTLTADDDDILIPSDNPTTGRWHKFAFNRASPSFGGQIICTAGASISGSGKAFQFYAQSKLDIYVQVGFGLTIPTGSKSIQVYKWNQLPNTSQTGKVFADEAPSTGGKLTIDIDATNKYISFGALFSDTWDGCYFFRDGNTFTLVSR